MNLFLGEFGCSQLGGNKPTSYGAVAVGSHSGVIAVAVEVTVAVPARDLL